MTTALHCTQEHTQAGLIPWGSWWGWVTCSAQLSEAVALDCFLTSPNPQCPLAAWHLESCVIWS